MANVKSQLVTDRETYTTIIQNPGVTRSDHRQVVAVLSTGDNGNGDTTEVLRLPTRARLFNVEMVRAAHTGATDVSLGLRYPLTGGDPVQISAAADECIFDSQDLSAAAKAWTPMLGLGTNGIGPTSYGKMLWELA